MATVGFQAYRRGSGLIEGDTLENIDSNKLPGYYDNAEPGNPPYWENGNPIFESYLDDDTSITREAVKDASFAIYDSDNHGGELKIFDVTDGNTEIILDKLPDDMSVKYTGVASQLVYYQCDIADYGSIRFYFNDHNPYYAGDVVINTGSGYKWVYLKRGDGIDNECFAHTTNNPNYNDVHSPDDLDNPNGEWSNHSYNGLVDLSATDNANEDYDNSYIDLYTFIFDFDLNSFSGSGVNNGVKRPAGSDAFSYLMVDNKIMNTGFADGPNQFTYPHLNLNEITDIGGFATYTNDGNPKTDIAFKNRPGDLDNGNYVSGYHQINMSGEGDNVEVFIPGNAFVVYHEDDYHADVNDLTHIVYLDARLDYVGLDKDGNSSNDILLSRKDLKKQYGWYAWDSGLYSTIYDDGNIIYTDADAFGIKLNPLYFALGRMNVYAYAPHQASSNGPTYSDSWFDRIISMQIELQLRADLRYATDSLGKSYGSAGDQVSSGEFAKRFFSFIPDWISTPPSSPVASPHHFQGTDDVNELPYKFMVVPQAFKINHDYVHYSQVYTKPPDCYPSPEDGPFSDNVEVLMKIGQGDMTSKIFYTKNGSDPVITGDVNNINTLASGNSSTLIYTSPILLVKGNSPITLTVVGYEKKTNEEGSLETKECSLANQAVYTFTKPGSTLTCKINTSAIENETPVFAGLFTNQVVSLDGPLNPIYGTDALITSNKATITIENIPDGTYYLCVIGDVDKNSEMSIGDKIYPLQGTPIVDSHQISAFEITVPATTEVNIAETSWSTY